MKLIDNGSPGVSVHQRLRSSQMVLFRFDKLISRQVLLHDGNVLLACVFLLSKDRCLCDVWWDLDRVDLW